MIADAPGWVQALVLGIVQGVTEFVPVSSSGHLVLVPALAGWERHGLAFDVALHVGTLVALLAYYRRDLWGMARSLVQRTRTPERDAGRRLVGLLAIASVPVAVAGLTAGGLVEAAFDDPGFTAVALLVTATVLVVGERISRRRPAPTDDHDRLGGRVTLGQALTVGAAQVLALLPGVSRSGTTISAGIAAGLSRPDATRFAFLLGLPAIAGAAVVEIPRIGDLDTVSAAELAIGVGAAAVSGYLAIALLVRLVTRIGVDRFAWYLVPAAVVAFVVLR